MLREVEVKFRIADAAEVMARFKAEGVTWSSPVIQDDQAYAPSTWSYGMDKTGVPFARLRTEDERHLFTVKTPQSNEMDCLEHETTVADRAAMHAAVVAMGFAPTVRIVKTRRSGSWGEVSLCLDEVEHAGTFLELELLTDDDSARVQQRLAGRIQTLGIEGVQVTDTYDTLVRNALRI
jgi:adenylate cyclase class 2